MAYMPVNVSVIDGRTGRVSREWQEYFRQLDAAGGGAGITQLTGDVLAGPGSGSVAAALSNTGVTAGTYGDGTHVGQFTVTARGRLTAAANVAITPGAIAVSVDAAGALDGDGTTLSPLAVRVDGTTITINGSNNLEVIGGGGGGSWFPLVDGSEPPAFITDGAGVLIAVAYP